MDVQSRERSRSGGRHQVRLSTIYHPLSNCLVVVYCRIRLTGLDTHHTSVKWNHVCSHLHDLPISASALLFSRIASKAAVLLALCLCLMLYIPQCPGHPRAVQAMPRESGQGNLQGDLSDYTPDHVHHHLSAAYRRCMCAFCCFLVILLLQAYSVCFLALSPELGPPCQEVLWSAFWPSTVARSPCSLLVCGESC